MDRQICCHIRAEEEAIRVMSRKPPAATIFMMPSSESLSWIKFTREEAMTWGKWLIAAVT